MESELNFQKDFYGILGVDPSATVEELKSAHIRLALKYHPDMAGSAASSSSSSSSLGNGSTELSMNEREARFREVSEAWSVLSKADTRSRYDSFRARQGYGSNGVDGSLSGPTEIPLNYDTQRANFASVKHAASSNWKELKVKYKTEHWQNMPLPEKKLLRKRHVGSLSGSIILVAVPCILIGTAAYSYWSSHFGVEATKTRKKLAGAK